MSEQNEVVIRKFHDGYLVELLDCPLAYTFSSQDEAERFIGPVWQRLDYVKDLHSQALRTENARLREALVWALGYTNFRAREHGEGPYWWRVELRLRSKLTGEQIDATLAALQPERGTP